MEQALLTFAFGLLSSAISATCASLITWAKTTKKRKSEADETEKRDLQKLEKGVMLLMRSDLIRLHDEFVGKKGYCSTSTKMSIEEEYQCYHELGGNGIVTNLREEIENLPEHPQTEE